MGWSTMRLSRLFVVTVALAASSTAWAQSPKYEGVGRPATDDEIKALDISIGPAGKEYPPGQGTAKQGAPVYAAKCAVCHGPTGEEGGVLKELGEHSFSYLLVERARISRRVGDRSR